ncbi:hypothetical protein SAMN06265379_10483 [Saccharicrinis carchari]|uniref:AF1548-like C-terminal domain-containing protein n=1 Tax=Saccharicrinis carchari TaxID=1168039 RepID=A0A521D065_SACCC|nr:restriction endonuclease [Saccharicrinis carchari]SMO65083.1 hypothetical protein SAMN06265379_10483 [Saccharicrinis carchari]
MDNKTSTKNILIKKASGDEELFMPKKLRHSLLNAGAQSDTVAKIVADIQDWIFPGATTKEIYRRAFSILHREATRPATRYKLKQALFALGPTGYPFEILIGQLFKQKGFDTEVGVVVDGHCLTHEMDVIATNNSIQHLMECKYHKDQGKHVSIQVPLYVRSRVDDIIRKREGMEEYRGYSFTGWVVTNTSFSSDSLQYGNCNGLNLLAWDYPIGKGLKNIIEDLKIYPITILNNLNSKAKQHLLNQGVVTCSQLLENMVLLQTFGLSKTKYDALRNEINQLCF